MINYKAIGQRIKSERKKFGLTQEKLAENLSISIEHLSRIETGAYHPSLSLITKISETLNTNEAFIMFGENADNDINQQLLQKINELSDKKKDAVLKIISAISNL